VQETEPSPLPAQYQWYVHVRLAQCFFDSSALFLRGVDKTIKLWKVFEKEIRVVANNNMMDGYRPPTGPIPGVTPTQLRLPRMVTHEKIVAAVPRKVYANAHAYHINSISINSDQETYISSDDLRVNLWNLGISDQSFSKIWIHFGTILVVSYN
jgi:serine/threonine-protein phosphatase 2A regulatory subunit B